MKSCINFFYKTILNKKSIYLFTLLLIFVYILVTYILPYALKININQLLQMSIILVLLILLIAIYAIIVSSTIFRQGIDDGSEILILTKSVSRKQIVLSKTIVLISFILFISIIAFIIPIFLNFSKYGTKSFLNYSGGYFLSTLLVSTLFSAISIFFCLIMKKSYATLASIGIAFVLTIIDSVNFLLVNNPGYYFQKQGYSIQKVNYYDSNNNPVNGVILNQFYLPYICDKQDNIIEKIEEKGIKKTSTNIYASIDPFYQFSTLFSLGNFYESENNFSGKNINNIDSIFSTSSWNNYYLSFTPIQKFNLKNEFNIIEENTNQKYTYIFNNNLKLVNQTRNINVFLNQKEIKLGKYFILPILDSKNNLNVLNIYDLENYDDLNKLANLLFSDQANSIFSIYKNYISSLESTSNYSIINFFDYISFLYSYLFLGCSLIFENIVNNSPIKIEVNSINLTKQLNLDFLIDYFNLNKQNLIDYYKLKNSNELLNPNFIKPSIIYLMLIRANIYNFQKYIIDSQNSWSNKTLDPNDTLVNNFLSLFQYNNSLYSNFLVLTNKNIADNNNKLIVDFNNENNPGYLSNLLNSWNVSKILISSSAFQFVNTKTLNTFSNYKFEYFINIYGLIFGWLLASILLLVISTIIYTKKDVK